MTAGGSPVKLGIWLPVVSSHQNLRRGDPGLQAGEETPLPPPGAVRSFLGEIRQAGVTTLLLRMPSRSTAHYVDQLAALRELADGPR